MSEALADPFLCHVQIGKERVVCSIDPAKACLQVPLARSHLVVVRETNQHRHQALPLIEDHHAVLVEAGCNAHGLKAEGHAAA
jgi:hypothetical protein